ncbi:MAG: hypothetical protein KBB71_08775 [Lentimicrobiaceae bacterium]|nr:hypothetical protein [Lentimicrobiaceae bacterium]
MEKLIFSAIAIFIGLSLYSQEQKVNSISILGKTDTTYQFTITGKNLDNELGKLNTTFGKPLTESEGEIIWNKVDIPNIGNDLQIKMVDGLLTIKGNSAKFKPFKDTENKNKSKNCQLKCLDENENRQLYFTVMDKDNNNIIGNDKMRIDMIEFLESVIM